MPQPKATFTITAVNKTKAAFGEINASLKTMAKRAGVVGAAVSAAGSAITAFGVNQARDVAKLGDSMELLGISSAESLQKIVQAGEEVDIQMQSTQVALQRLARRGQDAVDGNENLAEAFAEFGISIRDLQSLEPDELFFKMADGLDDAREKGVDLSAAMAILDTEGVQLIRTMDQLATDGFQKAWQEAERFGAVIDEDTIEKAKQVRETWERMTSALRKVSSEFFVDIAHSVFEFFGLIEETAGEGSPADVALTDFFVRQADRHRMAVMDEEARELEKYATLEAMANEHFHRMLAAEGRHVDDIKAELDAEQRAREAAAGRLLTDAARNSKVFFELDKARAIAQAALSSREAVLGAYAVGARIGGPPLGAAFAAAAAAATAVQVAAIASQSYGAGGGGVATGGPGGQSATAGELAGTSYQPRQNITVEFQSGTGFYDENSVRRLIDTLREVEENGNPSLSGRFTVAG